MELRKIFLFEDLDETTIKKIEDICVVSKLYQDNILFYEGDEPDYMHILIKGIIKLYKITANDKELILKYFQEKEMIAEVACFENIPFPATSEAFTDCEVLKIDFKKFKKIMIENPEISFKVQTSLIKKVKNLENLISTHLVLDTRQKVAKYVYNNSDSFFDTKNLHIAQILNITPETLSRVLKIFKDKGIINLKDKIIHKELLKEFM